MLKSANEIYEEVRKERILKVENLLNLMVETAILEHKCRIILDRDKDYESINGAELFNTLRLMEDIIVTAGYSYFYFDQGRKIEISW